MEPTPRFIQGTFSFTGGGLAAAAELSPQATYKVPGDRRAQLIYLRAGNASDVLVCLTLLRNGEVMRLFPIGAKSAVHVPLAVVEDIFPDSELELKGSAPEGVTVEVVVDLGFLEAF